MGAVLERLDSCQAHKINVNVINAKPQCHERTIIK